MIPARYSPILHGLILSGLMSCIVSGMATLNAIGLSDTFLGDWMGAWAFCWPVAFCVVLFAAPLTGRLVKLMTRPEA